jgi:hypothetical protein
METVKSLLPGSTAAKVQVLHMPDSVLTRSAVTPKPCARSQVLPRLIAITSDERWTKCSLAYRSNETTTHPTFGGECYFTTQTIMKSHPYLSTSSADTAT